MIGDLGDRARFPLIERIGASLDNGNGKDKDTVWQAAYDFGSMCTR